MAMVRTDNLTGALLMMASMAAFTLNDTMMKMLAGDVPLFQLLFLRGVITSVLVALMAWHMKVLTVRLPPRDLKFIGLRTVAEIGMAYFFLTALFNMPLANVTAILQTLPLTITLAAALFLNEPIGWRRLSGILIGFIGVLLIVRPGSDGFSIYSLYAMAAVGFVTLRDLITRKLSKDTPSMLVTLATSFAIMVFFGFASLTEEWAPMDGRAGVLIAGASLMVIGGYLFAVMVMRVGEISFTAPFRYTALIWALGLGWLAFGEWPDPVTMAGAGIVVGSGLFMLYREAQLGRSRRRSAAPHGP